MHGAARRGAGLQFSACLQVVQFPDRFVQSSLGTPHTSIACPNACPDPSYQVSFFDLETQVGGWGWGCC